MNIRNFLLVTSLGAALAATASAQTIVYYQDSFSRPISDTAILNGTQPDVFNINGNTWQNTNGDFGVGINTYVTNGSAATIGGTGAIDGTSYLPVNGLSGVILDGTANFTLSVVISQGGNTGMGIGLNNSVYAGGSMFGSSGGAMLAGLVFNDVGNILPYYNDAIVANPFASVPDGTPTLLMMSYDADNDQLAYSFGGNAPFFTQSGVTAAQIASLNYVSINNTSFGNNIGTFDDFTLTVTVPEPATAGLLFMGGMGLVLMRRKRVLL